MISAIKKALELIFAGDMELLNILGTTARMSLASSVLALLIGLPIGIIYGSCRFRSKNALIIANRTLMGIPPVVCGLFFYLLFSGVGPFGKAKLLFTVPLMIIAQVVLITPTVIGNIESHVSSVAPPIRETAKGVGIGKMKTFLLIANECRYQFFFVYLLAFSRAIAEVGAVSMVGGAIAWKTNVMTTAIMQYTNKGNFTLGIALGIILLVASLIINTVITLIQRRLSR